MSIDIGGAMERGTSCKQTLGEGSIPKQLHTLGGEAKTPKIERFPLVARTTETVLLTLNLQVAAFLTLTYTTNIDTPRNRAGLVLYHNICNRLQSSLSFRKLTQRTHCELVFMPSAKLAIADLQHSLLC